MIMGIFTTATIRNGFLIKSYVAKRPNQLTNHADNKKAKSDVDE